VHAALLADGTAGDVEAGEPEHEGVAALAGYSGLSVRTLRTHLRRWLLPLPHYHVGGKILVRRSEFDQWIAQFRRVRQRDATSDPLAECVNELLDSLTKRRAPAENRPPSRRA